MCIFPILVDINTSNEPLMKPVIECTTSTGRFTRSTCVIGMKTRFATRSAWLVKPHLTYVPQLLVQGAEDKGTGLSSSSQLKVLPFQSADVQACTCTRRHADELQMNR